MSDISLWLTRAAISLVALALVIAIAALIRFRFALIKLIVLEVLANLLIASIALWSLITHQVIVIDIILPLALILFLGTVAYYQFLSQNKLKDDRHD